MFRFPSARRACRTVLLVLSLCLPGSPSATAADVTRLLEVFVNGRPTHLLVELIDRDGKLLARADDVAELGLMPSTGQPLAKGAQLVPLQDIPGLSCTIDEQRQELHLTAQDRAMQVQRLGTGATAAASTAEAGFGTVLNYDLEATSTAGRAVASGTFGSVSFTPWGTATTDWLMQAGLPTASVTRLDSTLIHEDLGNLRRWLLGDTIAGGLDWTRPYRLGGIQVASNFTLRPDLVTFPVPALTGHADVPSTMDLFVNGVHALSRDVTPGPFQLQQPPLLSGAGDLSVVVRDPVGHESVQTLNFYTSTSLLAPGLFSYSAEAGYLRNNYGLVGDGYTRPVGSATVRTGLANWLTAESHAEVSAQAGGGLAPTSAWPGWLSDR